jgi:predicted RNase H-like HicB family nuclease
MKKTMRILPRVVFYKEDGDWVAHCLEFDLVGHGATQDEALGLLGKAIEIQIEQSIKFNNPANLFRPAESKYFRMFFAGSDLPSAKLEVHLEDDAMQIEDAQTREYCDDHLIPA